MTFSFLSFSVCEVSTEHIEDKYQDMRKSGVYFTALYNFYDFFGNYVNEFLKHRLSLIFF